MKAKLILFLFLLVYSGSSLHSQISSLAWAKSFGGPNSDYARSIAVDAAGNVYTTGGYQDTVDFDPGPGVYNLPGPAGVFVSKLDAAGNFVWAKKLGAPNCYSGYAIAIDAAGNVYSAGQFQGLSDFDPGPGVYNLNGLFDIYVSKLDGSGNFVWAKSFGANDNDCAYSIAVDNASNVYFTGAYGKTVDFDPGPGIFNLTSKKFFDVFVCKLDVNGDLIWVKSLGGNGAYDVGRGITTDPAGNIYTTGTFEDTCDFDPGPGIYTLSTTGAEDIFVCKLDPSGNFVWAKKMGSSGYDYPASIALDAGGNIYTTGGFQLTCDFDPGPLVMNISPLGMMDVFISKLDASGNFVWAKNFGGNNGNNRGFSLAIDNACNIYSTGLFSGQTDFDPGPGVYNISTLLSSNYDSDIYFSKLDSSGNFLWAGSIGKADTTYEGGQSITVDVAGNIYVSGFFEDTCDADPGPGIYNLFPKGTNDAFVLKLYNTVGIEELSDGSPNAFIYPNPNNGSFYLRMDKEIKNGEIQLINTLGQVLHSQKIDHGTNEIRIQGLPGGLYHYSILKNKIQIQAGKIVFE